MNEMCPVVKIIYTSILNTHIPKEFIPNFIEQAEIMLYSLAETYKWNTG